MKRRIPGIAVCVLALLALTGLTACEKTKQALGQGKKSPDEFAVYSRAPLSVPPEFQLRPPRPGAERPQAVNPRDRVLQTLSDNSSQNGARQGSSAQQTPGQRPATGDNRSDMSAGEIALLRQSGALEADPAIRLVINRETAQLLDEDASLADKILFWQDPAQPGAVVDPDKEAKRLREAQALGTPLNKGDVPVIERKQKAIFEGVFN